MIERLTQAFKAARSHPHAGSAVLGVVLAAGMAATALIIGALNAPPRGDQNSAAPSASSPQTGAVAPKR